MTTQEQNTSPDERFTGNTPPDAVAVWQNLAENLTDTHADRPRGGVRLGLVDTLSLCDALPFWHKFFSYLGFSVIVAPHRPAGLNDLEAHGRETVPSESVCYPAKMSHIRAAAVIDKGANAVFMPLYDRYARCPVSCEYANAVGRCMPQLIGDPGKIYRGVLPAFLPPGQAAFLSPLLLLRKPWTMLNYPQEVLQLLISINAILPDAEEVSAEEIARALLAASQAQEEFQNAVNAENERALAWAHAPGHHGILLVGRPYHWDRSLLHDVNAILTSIGLSVMTSHPKLDQKKTPAGSSENSQRWGMTAKDDAERLVVERAYRDRAVREKTRSSEQRSKLEMESMPEVGDRAPAQPFWFASKHMGRMCELVASDPDLDVVCLQSFSCGYDAASVPEARDILRTAGKPFTLLMIDDSVNTSHLTVRLRTLAAAIRQRKAVARAQAAADKHAAPEKSEEQLFSERKASLHDMLNGLSWEGERRGSRGGLTNLTSFGTVGMFAASVDPRLAHKSKPLMPSQKRSGGDVPWERETERNPSVAKRILTVPLSEQKLAAAKNGDISAFADLGSDDYEAARLSCENYCFIAAVLTGRALRICAALPDLRAIVVPFVCDKCLLRALPRTVIRTLGYAPEFYWERNSPLPLMGFPQLAGTNPAKSDGHQRPLVGIVGAPPLVFDAHLNDNLLQTIVDGGCQPVLPWLDLMLVDDITYDEQLEEFAQQGVSAVIYLISFGCLKGHTQIRTRLAELRAQYPTMPITIIDFDGDASSLNRKNRVALALASAKDAFARAQSQARISQETKGL